MKFEREHRVSGSCSQQFWTNRRLTTNFYISDCVLNNRFYTGENFRSWSLFKDFPANVQNLAVANSEICEKKKKTFLFISSHAARANIYHDCFQTPETNCNNVVIISEPRTVSVSIFLIYNYIQDRRQTFPMYQSYHRFRFNIHFTY